MQNQKSLHELIQEMRRTFSGFNSPASERGLAEFQRVVGALHDDVLTLYRDHNGSNPVPTYRSDGDLTARLMPIAEVLQFRDEYADFLSGIPGSDKTVWLWTDDNSNWCGIYNQGPLNGFVVVVDHERPTLAPAFRSVGSFLSRLLDESPTEDDDANEKCAAYDIPGLTCELPLTEPDPENRERDKEIASYLRQRYEEEQDQELRRYYAFCSICMTPFEDTEDVLPFLEDIDWQTGPAAIRLFELRRFPDAVERLEELARESNTHRGSRALICLAGLKTRQSEDAIGRLKRILDDRRLSYLERLLNPAHPLPPPKWR